jgi:hypothetical protein
MTATHADEPTAKDVENALESFVSSRLDIDGRAVKAVETLSERYQPDGQPKVTLEIDQPKFRVSFTERVAADRARQVVATSTVTRNVDGARDMAMRNLSGREFDGEIEVAADLME